MKVQRNHCECWKNKWYKEQSTAKFRQGLRPRAIIIIFKVTSNNFSILLSISLWPGGSLFPQLQTNLCHAAYWDSVLIQPAQYMERMARDLFKTVEFPPKGPLEKNIWFVQSFGWESALGMIICIVYPLHSNEFTPQCLLG